MLPRGWVDGENLSLAQVVCRRLYQRLPKAAIASAVASVFVAHIRTLTRRLREGLKSVGSFQSYSQTNPGLLARQLAFLGVTPTDLSSLEGV